MQNREFEKNMQKKMDELKFVPSDAVWDKVEAALPAKKKKRHGIFFILFFAVLLFGSLIWFNKTAKNGKETKDNIEVTKVNIKPTAITKNEGENKQIPFDDTMSLNPQAKILTGSNPNIQRLASASLKIKIKSGVTEGLATGADDNLSGKKQKKLKSGSKVKTIIKAPLQYTMDNEKNEETQAGNEENAKVEKINNIDTDTATIENKAGETLINADSMAINKKDTAALIVANKNEKKKMSKISKWQYGIYLSAGSSAVTNKLFNNAPVFATVNSSVFFPGSPVTPTGVNIAPVNPAASLGLGIGFFASKNINNKWKFSTGINYMCQSNSIKVGTKVDTATTLNFDLNRSISASNYYRAGNTGSYKNKFHLVEIPLLFQFNFSGSSAFYLEAGPAISYLFNSNALVYNTSSSSYITDDAVFNKLLLSANAGVGFNVLKKSKLPFSIGYQFKYAVVSAVQKSFGKQHFVNSLFYLKVPLKK